MNYFLVLNLFLKCFYIVLYTLYTRTRGREEFLWKLAHGQNLKTTDMAGPPAADDAMILQLRISLCLRTERVTKGYANAKTTIWIIDGGTYT